MKILKIMKITSSKSGAVNPGIVFAYLIIGKVALLPGEFQAIGHLPLLAMALLFYITNEVVEAKSPVRIVSPISDKDLEKRVISLEDSLRKYQILDSLEGRRNV